MIDLSFLTEEEQETILAVLKRDAELKKAEEKRVQNLQQNVGDRGQLRYLTGEWFYETKQLRHQDRIHGSDIIRASMKHTHKPLTILELSQILPERPSFVSSENKEVFVPPVLSGLLQEPQLGNRRDQNLNPYEPLESPKLAVLSPSKARKNPFNNEVIESHSPEESSSRSVDVSMHQTPSTSNGYDDKSSPVVSALSRLSSKIKSSSKSLENLISQTSDENNKNSSRGQMNRSVDDVSELPPSPPPFANSKKASMSVPVLQQDETDSDSALENHLRRRTNTGSSMSNLSLSSGMASMSSVCPGHN